MPNLSIFERLEIFSSKSLAYLNKMVYAWRKFTREKERINIA